MPKSKVVCPLCGSQVTKDSFKDHFEAEKYVLERIAKDHPDWKEENGGCKKCLEYYLELGK